MGTKRSIEITKATATAMPHEAAIPKAWKKRARRKERGSLSSSIMVTSNRVNSVLLLAMKTEFITDESVKMRTKKTKAREKIAFFLMKPRAGDQISKPAIKIADSTRAAIPLKVRQELIMS